MTTKTHSDNQATTISTRDARIRAGRITADVYLNPTSRGQMFAIDVYASYRDSKGDWHRSSSFKANDLPFVEKAVQQAYAHCERNREKANYRHDADDNQDRADRVKESLDKSRTQSRPSAGHER